jgi:signal transduction histidine kinase
VSLDVTQRSLAGSAPEATRHFAYVRRVAEEALDEIRTIVRDLRPTLLDDLGLPSAVRAHAHRVLEPAGAVVEIETAGLGTRLPPPVETVLFRIIEESLTGIATHARATRVGVRVAREERTVRATVTDNGTGFEPAVSLHAGEGRAIGVFVMQERAAAMGGHVRVCSLPGAGTRIDVMLPCGGDTGDGAAPTIPAGSAATTRI